MASTPSPAPAELPSTPPAPRFGGYYDNWEPYQPRKSARIANRSSNRTPSPTGRRTIDSTASSHKQPSKTNPIPKCRLPSATSAPGATTSSMGSPKSAKKAVKPAVASSSSGMPTPTKTPRKPQSAKQSAELDSVSRDIFNTRSGRTPKKLTGSTLESFEAQELDQDFTIFSDSCNRVPTRDESNPFYDPRPARQTRTQGRRKMVKIPGEGMQPVDKAVGREDGLLMNL